jgi:hypothetical protein
MALFTENEKNSSTENDDESVFYDANNSWNNNEVTT